MFDKVFDFNRDGELSTFEKAMVTVALSNMMEEGTDTEGKANDIHMDINMQDIGSLTDFEREDILENAGLCVMDLWDMNVMKY